MDNLDRVKALFPDLLVDVSGFEHAGWSIGAWLLIKAVHDLSAETNQLTEKPFVKLEWSDEKLKVTTNHCLQPLIESWVERSQLNLLLAWLCPLCGRARSTPVERHTSGDIAQPCEHCVALTYP